MPSTDLDLARASAGPTDPHIDRTKKHELVDIVAIALCAVDCGADSRRCRSIDSLRRCLHQLQALRVVQRGFLATTDATGTRSLNVSGSAQAE